MRNPLHIALLVALCACSNPPTETPVNREPMALADVVKLPLPGTVTPTRVAFSPDDSLITFLHAEEGSLQRELWSEEVDSGARRVLVTPPGGGEQEGELSLEEQLRRERLRERATGITRYGWTKRGERIVVPIKGDVYVQDGAQGSLRPVVVGVDAQSPTASPDGQWLAWVEDDEVMIGPLSGGPAVQITHGARGTGRTHGLAEYIAQEEMGRMRGFWWSESSDHVAYTEVDETHIPTWRIPHMGADSPQWEDHRYPFAGAQNARVSLHVVPREGGESVELDLSCGGTLEWEYLARVRWLPDGALLAVVQDRLQQRLDIVRLDPNTGRGRVLLTEHTDVWINLHHMLRPLEQQPGAFLWATERSGFQHLVLVAADGRVAQTLTEGEWIVDDIAGVDEDSGQVWFTGTRDDARERHLYRVSLGGGEFTRLTHEPGMHSVTLDHGFKRFVDTWSTVTSPPRTVLRSLADGSELRELARSHDPRVQSLDLPPPQLVELDTADGHRLYGALYRPQGQGPWPTVVSVYGGPHAQRVTNSWGLTADMRAQALAGRGFLVFKLDNRGSARRGLAFEGAIRHDLGNLEVSDQVEGVNWLVSQGLTDPSRVGIYGWSYGGYMSAMALMRAPETFRVGVAGAPVTHWDTYDTHYTERYMGTPQSNPEGYERSAVMAHVEQLEGQLMLVHGMIDENVHFRHTARLVNALHEANKSYELLIFPSERHSPRRDGDRLMQEKRVVRFFQEHL